MRLMIRSLSEKLPSAILEAIDQLVQKSLFRVGSRIKSIQLTLRDNNGPRGGVDQECRAIVHLNNGVDITVKEVQSTVMAAVTRVGERVAHAVKRRLIRKRKFAHVRMT